MSKMDVWYIKIKRRKTKQSVVLGWHAMAFAGASQASPQMLKSHVEYFRSLIISLYIVMLANLFS